MGHMKLYGPFFVLIASLLIALNLSAPASASSHKSSDDLLELSSMRLLHGWMRDDGWYMAAIQIDMTPGWKTYWRQPGAGGIAPTFDWSQSRNLAQVGYFWPSPSVFDAYGTRTIGYDGQLVLPILLKPKNPALAINARLTMDYGVCDDICVPVSATDSRRFVEGLVSNRDAIGRSVALRPKSGRAAGLSSATCQLHRKGDNFVLSARLDFNRSVAGFQAVVVETGSDTLWASDADHRATDQSLHIEADLRHYGDGAMTLDRNHLRFTLIGPGGTIDVQGCSG